MHIIGRRGGVVFLLLISLTALAVRASAVSASTGAESTVVDLKINKAFVEIATVGKGAFRLSVSTAGKPQPSQSIFLADPEGNSAAVGEKVKEGNLVGIKSDAGELLIDPKSGEWSLRDSAGKVLIPPCRIGGYVNDGAIELNVGWPVDKPVEVYGCGNGTASLLQGQGRTHLDNGRAVVPHYWSDAGYAALAVSADDNAPASWNPSESGITWRFPGSRADLYLMPAANLQDATRAYAALTGPPPVPPRWAFGYLQSRWGWKDRAYIDDTLKQFVDRNLPVDAFIFDFEWYATHPDYMLPPEGKADFTDFSFNPALFPDPAGQIAKMRENGIHFVGIRKPRIGNTAVLNDLRARGWIDVQAQADSRHWIVPRGEKIDLRNIDFQRSDVRAWYADQLIGLLKTGISGWWDDEGELTYTTYYWWNQAEADALAKVDPTGRLWTIDRAFQPGLQRQGAAAWTGDIHADWKTLRRTPTDLLNWSLAGMDYGACDIGGFSGEDTPELLARWMEAGVFFPVMRAHSDFTVQPRFPWLYGPEAESAIRHALEMRYRLIPLYYSLAHEAHESGLPIMRPLVMEFPDDPKVTDLSSQWLIGTGLMAAPILTNDKTRSVYLPSDTWFEFDTNTAVEGGRSIDVNAGIGDIPAYVRAGTILPLAPPILHTDQLPGGPLQLQIYPGKNAKFTLVEDDGKSTAYLKGDIRRTIFSWDDGARELSWKIDGSYAGADIFKTMQVTVFDPGGKKQVESALSADGKLVIRQ